MIKLSLKGENGKGVITELPAVYPPDFRDGWVHVITTVDREKGEMTICYDFGECITMKIPDEYKDAAFDGDGQIYIGTNEPGVYGGSLYVVLDEYLLLEGILERGDMDKLALLYSHR